MPLLGLVEAGIPTTADSDMLDSLSRILDEDLGAEFPAEDDWDDEIEFDNRGIV